MSDTRIYHAYLIERADGMFYTKLLSLDALKEAEGGIEDYLRRGFAQEKVARDYGLVNVEGPNVDSLDDEIGEK